jgi:soluble lytic murein transglycosylase-like protein
VVKSILVIGYTCFALAGYCMAGDVVTQEQDSPANQTSIADFETQVRGMAARTAAEEKAKKETARLAASSNKRSSAMQPLKVFKYQKNGTVMFADSAPFKTPYQVIVYNSCYACNLRSNVDWQSTKLYMTEFADIISQFSLLYNVDSAFIRAVIHAESAFNPLARSRKGAMGLMQLMPATAQEMGVRNASDPEQNIQGGVKYLASLLRTFDGDQSLAAAAYNAGPSAVNRHNGIPPYAETQTYVKRVNILKQRYKNQLVLAAK